MLLVAHKPKPTEVYQHHKNKLHCTLFKLHKLECCSTWGAVEQFLNYITLHLMRQQHLPCYFQMNFVLELYILCTLYTMQEVFSILVNSEGIYDVLQCCAGIRRLKCLLHNIKCKLCMGLTQLLGLLHCIPTHDKLVDLWSEQRCGKL